MRCFAAVPLRRSPVRPLALALGVFDGVHLGHQAVLRAAIGLARRRSWISAALTFDPPPEAALGFPVPLRLGHPDDQIERMAALGLGELYRVPFTAALGRLSPRRFASQVLAKSLACGAVVVGRGFRFGAGALGTVETLRTLGLEFGFTVVEVPPLSVAGSPVSSTRLRRAVTAGRLGVAARQLGRTWTYRGSVVRGRRLGRTLGFPTANVEGPQQVLPPRGVWVGRCRILSERGRSRWWGFAGNLGLRPSIKALPGIKAVATIELHLLGFEGRLEGRVLEVEFFKRLRPEKKFASLAALSAQIGRDVHGALAYLEEH